MTGRILVLTNARDYSPWAMKISLLLASVLLLPRLGWAHDGHPHIGDPVTHHFLEAAVIVLSLAALLMWARRARRRVALERCASERSATERV